MGYISVLFYFYLLIHLASSLPGQFAPGNFRCRNVDVDAVMLGLGLRPQNVGLGLGLGVVALALRPWP